jgi:hypothetical protein
MNSLESTMFHLPMAGGSLILTLHDLGLISLNTITSLDYETLMACVYLISFIYFVIDTYLMAKFYVPRNNIYFFHHVLALTTLPLCYFAKQDYAHYAMHYLLFELSTPFYNFTFELHKRGYDASYRVYLISQYLFVSIFVLIRVSNYYIVLPISLQILMYYWFNKILAKIRK